MEKVELSAVLREEIGKSMVKRLRAQDKVPAVVYKRGKETISIKLSKRELVDVLHTSRGENALITLKLKNQGKTQPKTVIMKDIQHEPLNGGILHVDFNEVSLAEKITVNVPIVTKGESIGVKEEGMLEHALWEVEIECLPSEIPENIEVDITELGIGDAVHVRDLILPKGIRVITDSQQSVLSVEPPTAEEVMEVEAAEETEVKEPEVISERKEPEGEDEADKKTEKRDEKKGSK